MGNDWTMAETSGLRLGHQHHNSFCDRRPCMSRETRNTMAQSFANGNWVENSYFGCAILIGLHEEISVPIPRRNVHRTATFSRGTRSGQFFFFGLVFDRGAKPKGGPYHHMILGWPRFPDTPILLSLLHGVIAHFPAYSALGYASNSRPVRSPLMDFLK